MTICDLPGPAEPDLVATARDEILPLLTATGADVLALLETEPARNTFPRLPVREGARVLAWFCRFDDYHAYQMHNARLLGDPRSSRIMSALGIEVLATREHLRLAPTARSALR